MLLIDAYNVLLTTGILPPRLAGLEVDGLIRLIGVSRYARDRIVIVCDGAGPSSHAARSSAVRSARSLSSSAGLSSDSESSSGTRSTLQVVYAGPGRDADSLIEDMLSRDSAARRWSVISNDRRIQRAARQAGASPLPSDVFLRQLITDEARPAPIPDPRSIHKIPLDRLDIALWMREFGYDPTEVLHRAPQPDRPADRDAPRSTSRSGLGLPPPPPPPPAPAHSSPHRAPAPPPPPAQRSDRDGASPPSRAPASAASATDPVLQRLLDALPGQIRLEDLDMSRWLDGIDRTSS